MTYRFVDQDEVQQALQLLGEAPGARDRSAFRNLRTRIRRNSMIDGLLRTEQTRDIARDGLLNRIHTLVEATVEEVTGAPLRLSPDPEHALSAALATMSAEHYLLVADRLERVLHRAEQLAQVYVEIQATRAAQPNGTAGPAASPTADPAAGEPT